MNITDELREYADKVIHREDYMAGLAFDLNRIADRIDEAVAGEYVRLPRDADGEPIRIGDVMESDVDYMFGEASFRVFAIWMGEGGWEVYDRLGDRYVPSALRHHHEPTVEDVLRDFAYCCEEGATEQSLDKTITEYAKRIEEVVKHE